MFQLLYMEMIMAKGNNNHTSVYKPTAGGKSPAHVFAHVQCMYNVDICTHVQLRGCTASLFIAANSGSGLDKENFISNCI